MGGRTLRSVGNREDTRSHVEDLVSLRRLLLSPGEIGIVVGESGMVGPLGVLAGNQIGRGES